jgi:hypothetical protein
MGLPDSTRHVLAGVLAAGAFLALYFPMRLEWYAALGLSLAVWGAVLVAVPRRRALAEIVVGERVTAADIARATRDLSEAARRVARAATRAPGQDRLAIETLAETLGRLRDRIAADPEEYRPAQRFVTHYLPRMVENVEAFVTLAAQGGRAAHDRVARLRASVAAYPDVVARIDRAGLDRDLRALEAEVEALDFQMKRG